MSELIKQNEDFLKSLIQVKSVERKKLIANCSEPQLKSLVECIINVKNLSLNKKQKRCLPQFAKLRLYFSKKKNLNAKRVRKFLIKNHKFLCKLLACVLSQILELALLCFYSTV